MQVSVETVKCLLLVAALFNHAKQITYERTCGGFCASRYFLRTRRGGKERMYSVQVPTVDHPLHTLKLSLYSCDVAAACVSVLVQYIYTFGDLYMGAGKCVREQWRICVFVFIDLYLENLLLTLWTPIGDRFLDASNLPAPYRIGHGAYLIYIFTVRQMRGF